MVKILVNPQNKAYITSGNKALEAKSTEKYGVDLDFFLGDVTNGTLAVASKSEALDFTGITNISNSGLRGRFAYCKILSINFGDLTEVTGNNALMSAFESSTLLFNELVFPKLERITGASALQRIFGSSAPKSISFPVLTQITGSQAFNSAFLSSPQTSFSFPELVEITSSATYCFIQAWGGFQGTTATFPKLETIAGNYSFRQAFYNSRTIENIYFPALISTGVPQNAIFNNMLQGVTGCTVHFPSNLQSVIGSWADVTAGFGGTNTVVLFDLEATT